MSIKNIIKQISGLKMLDFDEITGSGNGKGLGGEIFLERKKKVRIILTVFVISSILVLNLVLYLLSTTA